MYKHIFSLIATVTLVAGAFVQPTQADSWRLPEKEKYYSANKKFYVEVTPKKLESQLRYFEDKVAGRANAGAAKGESDNHAKAEFFARKGSDEYSRLAKFPLVNEVSPVSAIVSDQGDYFVTFDNWHSVGYGEDTIVIYRADGTVVRKFGLEDLLTAGDIETFSRSTSSMHWGGEHYFDEANKLLVLQIISNQRSENNQGVKFHELKIDLATGKPLEPKRDLFAQPRVSIVTDPPPAAANAGAASSAASSAATCVPAEGESSANLTRLPPVELMARVNESPLPIFSPVAKAAHASGYVTVEILIGGTGEVLCVKALSGPVLHRAAAVYAVRQWKFAPNVDAGKPGPALGTIAFNFEFPE